MKRLIYATALLAAAALLLGSGCRKEDDGQAAPCYDESNPDCVNYDPCWDRKGPVSAAFNIFQVDYATGEPAYEVGDTLLPGRVRFVASDSSAASYYWEVGNAQNTSMEASYTLDFPCELVIYQTIPIRLAVERLRDSACLAPEYLRDTVIRRIRFISPMESLVFGRYAGHLLQEPSEAYEIEVGYINNSTDPCSYTFIALGGIYVRNLHNYEDCQRPLKNVDISHDRLAAKESPAFDASHGCPPPAGFFHTGMRNIMMQVNQARDSIRIDFQFVYGLQNGINTEDLTFVGSRLP
jgi:hypothetical protein